MSRFIKRMIYGWIVIISILSIIAIFIYLLNNFTALMFALLIMTIAFCIGLLVDKCIED